MTIETKKYSRRPFHVEALRVDKSNINEVAEWCGGTVVEVPMSNTDKTEMFIQVDVHAPASERQSRAFPGDYVLLLEGGRSFKVYTTKAFNKNFVPNVDSDISEVPARRKIETKPQNGIKPEALEALSKMGESVQKASDKASETLRGVTDAVLKSGTKNQQEETKPAVPIDLPPTENVMSEADRAQRAQANREATEALTKTVETNEPEKKRKFIQQ